jgi:hypothetical protein
MSKPDPAAAPVPCVTRQQVIAALPYGSHKLKLDVFSALAFLRALGVDVMDDREADPTPVEPTITAGFTARWIDPSGPNPGARRKSVIRKSYIAPACDGSTGFSITLTESFYPHVTGRYHVRWRDDAHDETETFMNRADAMAAYERRIRDFRACAEGLDEDRSGRAARRPHDLGT